MPRIPALSADATPAAAQTMLEAVRKKLGTVPNLFKTLAHSPTTLGYYLGASEALGGGTLPAPLREQIALVTAGLNGCDYCASAHTLIGKGAGLSPDELAANLRGRSSDAQTQAALDFATAIVEQRGQISDAQLEAVLAAGYPPGEVVEIVAHVSINLFTNYFNLVAGTLVDFPRVQASAPRT